MSYNRRYYAVRIGRQGPRIYDNYPEFAAATLGFSGSSGKGFDNIHEAQVWLTGYQFGVLPMPMTTIHTSVNVNVNVSNGASSTAGTSMPTQTFGVPSQVFKFPNNKAVFDQMEGIRVKVEPSAAMPDVELSEEQKNVLKLVKLGRNIFFTGAAGTGKSVLLRAIIRHLRLVHGSDFGITAPTGIAGLNIGGQTIHSWAGIGYGKEPVEKLKHRLSGFARRRWASAQALIIDEVSMLDGRLFDKLEEIARHVRHNSLPFGGIQLIASGDFFQLPPVPDQDSTSRIDATFAFQARSWHRCIDQMVTLSRVFRQKDNKLIDMLSSMRTGVLEDWHIDEFQKLSRQILYDDGISPTLLFPLKGQVEQHNYECLSKLSGDQILYRAVDARGHDIYGNRLSADQVEKLLERVMVCPKEVPLKVGAQVMLLRNMSTGLVNGSLGKVIEFITIHDAQMRHIEVAEMARGDGERARPVYPPHAQEDPTALIAVDDHVFEKGQRWPLVQFTSGNHLLCSPVEFTVEGLNGNVEARRLQIPLVLSWAMSIHKSQGQTLSRVKVDLARIFEKGQAYVAISRATGMEGLEIIHFDPDKVMAHPDVIEWQREWDKERYQEEEMDSDWAVSQWHHSFHES